MSDILTRARKSQSLLEDNGWISEEPCNHLSDLQKLQEYAFNDKCTETINDFSNPNSFRLSRRYFEGSSPTIIQVSKLHERVQSLPKLTQTHKKPSIEIRQSALMSLQIHPFQDNKPTQRSISIKPAYRSGTDFLSSPIRYNNIRTQKSRKIFEMSVIKKMESFVRADEVQRKRNLSTLHINDLISNAVWVRALQPEKINITNQKIKAKLSKIVHRKS